ncbi:gluconokinase [Paenibacillus sp. NEAU-GSW1]|uniref:gluconokinase n=1 Tax=Paenibacillus sp. NEAU-GSW1 TaxID=2682486 RepID=UPI00139DCDE7|nr:gluconokinase [Paenibacillus sp. NEAU-GSW1]
MSKKYAIGVDIGTTSTKAVLFTIDGKVKANHTVGYPLHSPSPAAAEQDPDEIFDAVIESIKLAVAKSGAKPGEVAFAAFSSAMHSVIAVDRDGKPLTRSITWADNRSAHWTAVIRNEWNGLAVYRRTGTPIHPMSPLSKLAWLRHDHQELFERAYKFISIKEYVLHKLFGRYVIDYSIASTTGLFNLERLDWDEEALRIAGVTSEQLSEPVPATYKLEGLSADFAARTGLDAGTPFVIGASDGVLSNLGVNAVKPGEVAITIGTSGAIRAVSDRPVTDPAGRTFCYALADNKWVIGGPVNNGGMILSWAHDRLGATEIMDAQRSGRDSFELLTELAAKAPAGSEGLLFHPYLSGERAPLWDSNARGSYFGLTLRHQREHMVRAVMEGVIFNLHHVWTALEEMIGKPSSIQATGGFARSELWRQIMADIFDHEIRVPESYESSCLGAVVIGLYSLGIADSLDIAGEMVGSSRVHVPEADNAAVYRELGPIYRRVSALLSEEYAAIADFQSKFSG